MGSALQSLFYFFYSSISVFYYFLNLLIYRLRQTICVKHETKGDIVVIIITDKLARCAYYWFLISMYEGSYQTKRVR